MIVDTFPVGLLSCNCTILGDRESGEAVVIDAGDEAALVAARLRTLGLTPRYLIHTHAHVDHIGGLGPLRERCGGAGLLHHADRPLYALLTEQARGLGLPGAWAPVALDGELADGDVLTAGAVRVEVHHTPGHTPGSTTFAIEDPSGTLLFTGDTLFRGGVGRFDLGGTSLEDIVHSIRSRILTYPDATRVICGHGPATTVGAERTGNPFLRDGQSP